MKKALVFLSLVGVALFALASAAGANSGGVHVAQNCSGWTASVTLDNNVTADHWVNVTTTIPGQTGLVNQHFKTTPPEEGGTIWSASGNTQTTGSVTLNILNANLSVEHTYTATLPPIVVCDTTTTVAPTTTTVAPTTTVPVTTTVSATTTTTSPPLDTTTMFTTTSTTTPMVTTTMAPPPPGATTTTTTPVPPLPFTGSNSGALIFGGLTLCGAGGVLARRYGKRLI